jgi:hypothetical protein
MKAEDHIKDHTGNPPLVKECGDWFAPKGEVGGGGGNPVIDVGGVAVYGRGQASPVRPTYNQVLAPKITDQDIQTIKDCVEMAETLGLEDPASVNQQLKEMLSQTPYLRSAVFSQISEEVRSALKGEKKTQKANDEGAVTELDGFKVGDRVMITDEWADAKTRKEMRRMKEAPFGAFGTISSFCPGILPGRMTAVVALDLPFEGRVEQSFPSMYLKMEAGE